MVGFNVQRMLVGGYARIATGGSAGTLPDAKGTWTTARSGGKGSERNWYDVQRCVEDPHAG
jgi:hypothetical protein